MTGKKVVLAPVSFRALMQRINRSLAKKEQQLYRARGGREREALGDYYVVSLSGNAVVADHVDPKAFGRELGVLEAWESVEQA
jgi:hypothetical protein